MTVHLQVEQAYLMPSGTDGLGYPFQSQGLQAKIDLGVHQAARVDKQNLHRLLLLVVAPSPSPPRLHSEGKGTERALAHQCQRDLAGRPVTQRIALRRLTIIKKSCKPLRNQSGCWSKAAPLKTHRTARYRRTGGCEEKNRSRKAGS